LRQDARQTKIRQFRGFKVLREIACVKKNARGKESIGVSVCCDADATEIKSF